MQLHLSVESTKQQPAPDVQSEPQLSADELANPDEVGPSEETTNTAG